MDARPASVWRGAAKNDHSARHSLVCPVVLLRALSRPQTRLARGVVPSLGPDGPPRAPAHDRLLATSWAHRQSHSTTGREALRAIMT